MTILRAAPIAARLWGCKCPNGRRSRLLLIALTEALAVDVSCSSDALSVTLSDGRVVSAPLVWFPRLVGASARERSNWELIGGGIGIHWEAIDEDISVASLLWPENFMRLPNEALQPTSRERPVHKKPRTPRAARG